MEVKKCIIVVKEEGKHIQTVVIISSMLTSDVLNKETNIESIKNLVQECKKIMCLKSQLPLPPRPRRLRRTLTALGTKMQRLVLSPFVEASTFQFLIHQMAFASKTFNTFACLRSS